MFDREGNFVKDQTTAPVVVKYAESGYKVKLKLVPRRGIMELAPGQGEDGYGSKISTDRMIQFPGVRNGETLYCHGYDLEEITA